MGQNYRKGFTLIELLIAIAIISILSGMLMVNFIGQRERVRDGRRKSDLRQIQAALEFYRSDNGSYPASTVFTVPGCDHSFQNPPANNVTYMAKIPCDPSTETLYNYAPNGVGNSGYSITACLENVNDSEKDPTAQAGCGVSYTLQNP
jgi:type II secretion system protein G